MKTFLLLSLILVSFNSFSFQEMQCTTSDGSLTVGFGRFDFARFNHKKVMVSDSHKDDAELFEVTYLENKHLSTEETVSGNCLSDADGGKFMMLL